MRSLWNGWNAGTSVAGCAESMTSPEPEERVGARAGTRTAERFAVEMPSLRCVFDSEPIPTGLPVLSYAPHDYFFAFVLIGLGLGFAVGGVMILAIMLEQGSSVGQMLATPAPWLMLVLLSLPLLGGVWWGLGVRAERRALRERRFKLGLYVFEEGIVERRRHGVFYCPREALIDVRIVDGVTTLVFHHGRAKRRHPLS
ncbi:MAG: hypothetical protein OEY14_00815, partial [Myxococcales bacterium]|nr:hypothetical protein [Myxococcales bacterium]